MVDVVLLNSTTISPKEDTLQDTYPHLRLGIACIAAYIRQHGITVQVIDPQLERMTLEGLTHRIATLSPRVIGLTAYTEEIHDAAQIAKSVKDHRPNITTVVGGPHVSAIPKDTFLEFNCFDIGVIGEGEQAFLAICRDDELNTIKGIIRQTGNGPKLNLPRDTSCDLDDLPFPAWDLFELSRYGRVMPVELIRGCSFNCSFCFRSVKKSQVRYKSAEKVVEEIQWLQRQYGINRFGFGVNGTFPLKRSHAMEVCRSIQNSGLNISYLTATRVDLVDEELISVLKTSGCVLLNFGIESGDSEILRQCGKKTTPEKCEKALQMAWNAGIKTSLNFILGLPGETETSLNKTRRFAMKYKKYADSVNFAILVPYPGTAVYDWALNNRHGLKFVTKDWRKYGKQGGGAIAHANFKSGFLQKYQMRLYFEYVLRTPSKLWSYVSVKRVHSILKRLFGKG